MMYQQLFLGAFTVVLLGITSGCDVKYKVINSTIIKGCYEAKCGLYGSTEDYLHQAGQNECCYEGEEPNPSYHCYNDSILCGRRLTYYTCILQSACKPDNGLKPCYIKPLPIQTPSLCPQINDTVYSNKEEALEKFRVESKNSTKQGPVCVKFVKKYKKIIFKRIVKHQDCCLHFHCSKIPIRHPCCAQYREEYVVAYVPYEVPEGICAPEDGWVLPSSCCKPMDLIHVLDASGSIGGQANFDLLRNVLTSVNNALPFSSNLFSPDTKAGIVKFASNVDIEMNLGALQSGSLTAVNAAIAGITYNGGGTNIIGGLQAALTMLQNSQRPSPIPQVVVVYTDLRSCASCATIANQLRAAGAERIIVVAVYGTPSLIDYPWADHVYPSGNFANLANCIDEIIQSICDGSPAPDGACAPAGSSPSKYLGHFPVVTKTGEYATTKYVDQSQTYTQLKDQLKSLL